MERSGNTLPSTSAVIDHFKFIPFVASSAEGEASVNINQKFDVCNQLSGIEASQFYEEIISEPSTSVTSPTNMHVKEKPKRKSVISENSKHSLFFHAQNGNIEGIEYFLSKKCSVDVQDMYGWTALMCATFEGHYNAVKYLLSKGAKVDIQNGQGLSALDIAVKQKNDALIDLFKNGIVEEKCISSCSREAEEVKFCELCKTSFVESLSKHEKSIAHLFCAGDNNFSTYYQIPENNKGFQIMLKKGWDKNKGLGPGANGRKFPIKTILKTDRTCIGSKKEVAKVTHFGANDYNSIKKGIQPTLNLKKERKLKKSERKKLEQKNRAFEINFRRQFHLD